MQSTRKIIQKTLQRLFNNLSVRFYVIDRVLTPIPSTSSNQGLNNNPAIKFVRKKKLVLLYSILNGLKI